MKNTLVFALTAVILLSVIGCTPKPTPADTEWQLPEGQLALRKITDPTKIPDFTAACSDQNRLRESVDNSIHYMSKPGSQKAFHYGEISHDQALASLVAFRSLLDTTHSPSEMNTRIRQMFDVWESVGYDNKGTVRFTAYYTPTFTASRERTGQFRYPIYRLPADHHFDPEHGTVALFNIPRQQIESRNMLAGNELFYLGDAFEAYVVQIQGSAKLKLTDGSLVGIGYAGCNGMDYQPIRDQMVTEGKLVKGKANLKAMFDYFKAHPEDVQKYTGRNPRFVFHIEQQGPPLGSINEPVTKMRSIATDKKIFPRAAVAMVSAEKLPTRGASGMMERRDQAFFALDQDSGGGIRKAGRCDIYMGDDALAEALAGYTYQDGKLYYLFLKPGTTPPADLRTPSAPSAPPIETPATPPTNTTPDVGPTGPR